MSRDVLDELKPSLDELLQPMEGKVEYGNLRRKESGWEEEGQRVTNVAIVYETPGGSTDQINVTCYHQDQHFTILESETGEETSFQDIQALLAEIKRQVERIPAKRLALLRGAVDRWIQEGKTRMQIIRELNKFHRTVEEFKGGTITPAELSAASRYAITQLKAQHGNGEE